MKHLKSEHGQSLVELAISITILVFLLAGAVEFGLIFFQYVQLRDAAAAPGFSHQKAGARIYPTNEAFAQGLKAEEFGIGIMWKARAVQWQNAGISVETVAPKEGVPMYVSGFSIPKNAPNKEGAYAYMNAMLDKGAQENFAIDMGYNPTVTGATVAPDRRAHGVVECLIVVGNKGMTGAKRFFLGAVPNKISHHAPCDVLVVR